MRLRALALKLDRSDFFAEVRKKLLCDIKTHSIAATAVSAHECGHALQDATDYTPLTLRSALIPLASAGERFGLPLAIFGSVIGYSAMTMIGVLGYLGAIVVHLMVLPVEFNASKRALEQLDRGRGLPG